MTAVAGGLAISLGVGTGPATRPAEATTESGLVTTSSTREVAWTEQNPRHEADGPGAADRTTHDAMKDFRLRVSQTEDLLNQTVEVSWQGAKSIGFDSFVQLMQCWSDGPDISPTREQCAYGGILREGTVGTGEARTRALGTDPRERTYRNDGDLGVVSVDGEPPGSSWSGEADLVLGTNEPRCPDGTVGYTVTLVPPREAVRAGDIPATIVIEGPTSSVPASLTRTEGGFVRTYAAVTSPLDLSTVAAANSLTGWPLGVYRVQLGCNAADDAELARFVGYLDQVETAGSREWRRGTREGGVYVPFDPLGDTPDTAPTDPYLRDDILEYVKPRSTNEVWQALTRADGAGSVFMEMLTDLEAQHLGCGRVDADQVRSCWLVAVPRWVYEPDGSAALSATYYSPLSQTHWDRRIAVPLRFAPVAAGCRIGSGLKQVLAHDSALTALRSWQPTFCGDSSTATSVLGPLQDFSIRGGISEPNRMGVVGRPPEGAGSVVKAPLATSAVVVGFAVDRQLPYGSEDYELNGTRVTVMNLTARLVAKLLTQSYDSGAAPNGGKTSGYNSSVRSGGFQPTYSPPRTFPPGNPRKLYDDPEFLRLNPDFAVWTEQSASFLRQQDMSDVLVTASDTDAYETLWEWVVGDPAARAFLAGSPDPDGMLINPYYKGQVTADTSSFPQLDPTCVDDQEAAEADEFPLLCQINMHPRVEDDIEAAQAAVRGDTRRVNVAPLTFTGAAGEILTYLSEPRQEQGRLGMLVITTSGVAERYGLPTASLQNADGAFVAATVDGMSAARAQMRARSDGVLVPDPGHVRDGGYPLTTNSYALVDVAATTQAQNDAFATILDYAADRGQRPGTAVGQLPPGYAPLSAALAAQTRSAAALLRDPSSLLAQPPVSGPPPRSIAPPSTAPRPGGVPSPLAGPMPTAIPGAAGLPTATDAPSPRAAQGVAKTSTGVTPAPWIVPLLLCCALLAGAAGRVLRRLGRPPS